MQYQTVICSRQLPGADLLLRQSHPPMQYQAVIERRRLPSAVLLLRR